MAVIGIVGSGHAALAVARRLIDRGCHPIIVDAGKTLEPERQELVEQLGKQPAAAWDPEVLEVITHNDTVFHEKPKRLAFGSYYVYGGYEKEAPIVVPADSPAPTYALGGYSMVWGGAMLPAHGCDIADWPLRSEDLAPYYRQVIRDLPFAATEDELSREFPLYATNLEPLKVAPAMESLLRSLSKSRSLRRRRDVVFGRARLAVRALKNESGEGCAYCGRCLSGCVYGAIQNTRDDLTRLARKGQLEYRPGHIVRRLAEQHDGVQLTCETTDGAQEKMRFDRVFVAAGAINSTRIVLESKRLYEQRILMKTTQGFAMPMLRLRAAPFVWPETNTLAAVFFEFKMPEISDHWVHCQINSANELVMARFDFRPERGGLRDRLLMPGFKRLFVALCSFHSDHAGAHALTLRAGSNGAPSTLVMAPQSSETFARTAKRGAWRMFRLLTQTGIVPLLPFVKADYRKPWGWHFGGTLPMSSNPKGELETDLLGRPCGWNRVHVVDSSVFPSIPGTTVALLSMANAQRIADAVDLN